MALLTSALFLCACGGGGSAPATPPAPAAPSASTPADVTGNVVDDVTGQPITGATVYISEAAAIAGPSATTAGDGSFDVKNVAPSSWTVNFAYAGAGYPVFADAQWVNVFPADGHAAFHALRSIAPSGTTRLGTLTLALPSATDTAWLAQINADRATGTPPVNAPLIFDSITLQTARYWAQQMLLGGFFAHTCPAAPTTCVAFSLYETQNGSPPSSQNIYEQTTGGAWQSAEAAFIAEAANCPGGDWQTCTFGETTGHYINIMAA
ncbi:MAG TPA: carboxypeptidase regulatory-like domain-containing protein, partial [Candidatus Lustribacter sp.]|nr:carboxypeptidase regulatory-like domain-containing protein [Candidatus Lustribacter sp.]